ncbi:hypothetical protein QBC46DRAFT_314188 [Diplogelasinospora grovesii]|uniref:Copper acquisition factor BIM1-like domain-containing protein n=1 Tax=Diplogelasinospora grovesii TaxID=303347 RepID=A0AAN6N8P3_9PEZI|nr:hypothetical protein QBC46DRAFT_314188 [Diplogelasinospora grovesii]
MAPLRSLVSAALLFLSAANAHFLLLNPPSLEGTDVDEDKEPNAPCGADTPDLSKDNATDFHVGGDFISVQLAHPQANYMFRATLDSTASGNWTQLFPIVKQSGLGAFCEPVVTAPESWVGKKGIIGVACDAPDGVLYQCAVVNFVSGSNTAGSACKNASSVTGSFTTDASLSPLVGNGTTSSGSGSSTASSTSSASPSASKNAGSALARSEFPIGSVLVATVMVLAGTALL